MWWRWCGAPKRRRRRNKKVKITHAHIHIRDSRLSKSSLGLPTSTRQITNEIKHSTAQHKTQRSRKSAAIQFCEDKVFVPDRWIEKIEIKFAISMEHTQSSHHTAIRNTNAIPQPLGVIQTRKEQGDPSGQLRSRSHDNIVHLQTQDPLTLQGESKSASLVQRSTSSSASFTIQSGLSTSWFQVKDRRTPESTSCTSTPSA